MCTVLIVDDEANFLHILQVILQRAGYNVLSALNGPEALRMAEEHFPDLIILDDMMPGLSGSEVCITLKSSPELRGIPIVMHSAGTRIKNPDHIQSIGADAVLPQPALSRDLLDMVSRLTSASV